MANLSSFEVLDEIRMISFVQLKSLKYKIRYRDKKETSLQEIMMMYREFNIQLLFH